MKCTLHFRTIRIRYLFIMKLERPLLEIQQHFVIYKYFKSKHCCTLDLKRLFIGTIVNGTISAGILCVLVCTKQSFPHCKHPRIILMPSV